MFSREIVDELKNWAAQPDRKPLVLRGARQVGKTVAVDLFATGFDRYIHLDLQKPEDCDLFRQKLPVRQLVQLIALSKNVDLSSGRRLLFLDEIQNSPEATAMLRYFYEELPDLFVIAAGSLLEIMMEWSQVSFPVGRVEYRYMYPVSFREYLNAIGEVQALKYYNEIPLQPLAHARLLELFHHYTMIGGMPEIVQNYAEQRDVTVLRKIYEGLMATYLDDVAKYARSTTVAAHLRHAIETAPLEAGKRIVFQNFGKSNYKSREMSEALKTLERAMLVKIIYPTTRIQFPAQPDLKRSPRLQFLDTGLVNYRAGLQVEFFKHSDLHAFYNGLIAEHIAYQEIIAADSLSDQKPVFWTRELKQSNAEVDYLLPFQNILIPVEIKSGKSGKLRSLHQFMNAVEHPYAIRLYAGELNLQKTVTVAGKEFWLLNLPYFLAGKLNDYAEWMITEIKKKCN
ncbi:MAG TPA: AAA family ATPase [Candidatus Marinimicrobia bacterium]|nr:AAA family ATPase [Candidatus Neomarinimicrobiota bacterium]HQH56708.1 AAA family ATPase [Candidatus Neomarinimicrobiota bacterium]HRS90447.1 AAA family ATPase [Candidatus Neomarinimicrobiota bacterium]HRU45630.1 AAA family ATPase [Candidatus Neomarinimicrobiota bacterium]